MNWMHSAVLNGIGGVPCGAYEGMHKLKPTVDKLTIKAKIFDFLQSSKYVKKSIEDNYITEEFVYSPSDKEEIIQENIKIKAARANMNKNIMNLKRKIVKDATGIDTKTNAITAKAFKDFKKTTLYQQDHKNSYDPNDMVQLKSIERQRRFLSKATDPDKKKRLLTNKAIKMFYCMFKSSNKHIYLSPTDTHMVSTDCESWIKNLKD